jgi:hypothetical protein
MGLRFKHWGAAIQRNITGRIEPVDEPAEMEYSLVAPNLAGPWGPRKQFEYLRSLRNPNVLHRGLNADLLDGKHLQGIYDRIAELYQPLCPNLTALCALTGANGKLVRFTGPGAMAVTDILIDASSNITNVNNITVAELVRAKGDVKVPGASNPNTGANAASTLWADSGNSDRAMWGANPLAYLSDVGGSGDVTQPGGNSAGAGLMKVSAGADKTIVDIDDLTWSNPDANTVRAQTAPATALEIKATGGLTLENNGGGVTVNDSLAVATGATVLQPTEQAIVFTQRTTLDTSYYEARKVMHDRVTIVGTATDTWSITPVANGHYYIEVELKIECTASGGGGGDPAVGATAFRKAIRTAKVVGGTVTAVGTQTDLHNASETNMTGLALTIGAGMGVLAVGVGGGIAGNTYEVTRTVMISESTT